MADLDDGPTFTVTAPKDGSIMPPGVYMLFVTNNHIPSVAKWGKWALSNYMFGADQIVSLVELGA